MKVSLHSGGKEPEPYVLLIVRPSGARFYAARQLLEALEPSVRLRVGRRNLPLDIPPADPVATELCRKAVEEVLKERDEFAANDHLAWAGNCSAEIPSTA